MNQSTQPLQLVFLNRYFHPYQSATSQLLTDLAFDLAQDHEVHIIANAIMSPPLNFLPRNSSIRFTSTAFGLPTLADNDSWDVPLTTSPFILPPLGNCGDWHD